MQAKVMFFDHLGTPHETAAAVVRQNERQAVRKLMAELGELEDTLRKRIDNEGEDHPLLSLAEVHAAIAAGYQRAVSHLVQTDMPSAETMTAVNAALNGALKAGTLPKLFEEAPDVGYDGRAPGNDASRDDGSGGSKNPDGRTAEDQADGESGHLDGG